MEWPKMTGQEMGYCDSKIYNPILMLGLLAMCLILLQCCAHFSRDVFEVNLDLFPGLTAAAALSASYDEWLFRSAPIILNWNYSHIPIPLFLSSNALPPLPFKGTCFEGNKGPGHWLNHLFRTHHLQGLVAMLTSFSHAPGAPVSGASIPAVRPTEVGQSSPPTPAIGPFCLTTSVHPPHLCSCAVFLAAPQACDYSLMPALGSKDGGGWVLCLKAANMKMLQHKCEIMEVRPSVVCRGNNKKQPNTGRAIMKERRRLRDKMKEIKLTDRPDITFNPF